MKYRFRMTTDFEMFLHEAKGLFKKHREEVNLFNLPLNYAEDTYREYFDDNTFLLFESRYGDKLVGYCGVFLYENLHHKGSLHAKQDILFIDKEYRGHGFKFIKYIDDILKQIGVDTVLQSVPSATKDFSVLLKRLGYHKLETIYARSL